MLVGGSQEKCCHIKSSAYLFAIKVKNVADLVVKQRQPALYLEVLQHQQSMTVMPRVSQLFTLPASMESKMLGQTAIGS